MTTTVLVSLKRRIGLIIGAAMLGSLVACAGAGVKSGQYVDDSAITAKVKTEMAKSEDVRARKIHVETVGSEVHLSGFVASQTEKQRAEQIAYSVPGVRSVRSALVVQPE
jgi:osmotically-inducible protein OsmY